MYLITFYHDSSSIHHVLAHDEEEAIAHADHMVSPYLHTDSILQHPRLDYGEVYYKGTDTFYSTVEIVHVIDEPLEE